MTSWMIRVWLLMVLVIMQLGCASDSPKTEPAGSTQAAQQPQQKLPFDPKSVVRQASLEFSSSSDGFEASQPAYAVRVDPQGITIKAGTGSVGGRFSTTSVSRGALQLAQSSGLATRGAQAREVLIERGAVTEHVKTSATGVEQSWSLQQAPAGEGDLVVRVRVEGAPFSGSSPDGLHFAEGASGLRYGHGTWVDARGTRVHVPATWDGDQIALTVPADVVAATAWPAELDPVIGPEVAADPAVFSSNFPGDDLYPAVASDGTNFLVLWYNVVQQGLYSIRVGADGTPLDNAPTLLPGAYIVDHAVAFGNDVYLAVFISGGKVWGVRISTSGTLLDSAPFALDNDNLTDYSVSVAYDGTNFMAVWDTLNGSGQYDLRGARISPSGTALGAFNVVTGTTDQRNPDITFDGTNYLVVFEDFRSSWDIYGLRVSPAGAPVDAAEFPISTAANDQLAPAASAGNASTGVLVAWSDGRTNVAGPDIYAARVVGGAVAPGSEIAVSTRFGSQLAPDLAFGGNAVGWMVLWQDGTQAQSNADVWGARVNAAGALVDAAGILVTNLDRTQAAPAIAASASGYLGTWRHYPTGNCDIYGSAITLSGQVSSASGVLMSVMTNSQFEPAVAFDGTNYLVVWSDTRKDESAPAGEVRADLYGVRVSAAGVVLDSPALVISSAAQPQRMASLAFDGTNYLAVWTVWGGASGYDVWAARVSPSGVVLDPAGIAISTTNGDQTEPSVAAQSAEFLVVFRSATDIRGARVASNGTLMDPAGFGISVANGTQAKPVVTAGSTGYFVAWEDGRMAGRTYVYGARVADGMVLDGGGILLCNNSNYANYRPSVAFDGSGYLVAWELAGNIAASRVTTAGVLLDLTPITVSGATGTQDRPVVIADGSAWLVAWRDARSSAANKTDVYATRVTSAGTVIDTAGYPVTTSAVVEGPLAMARGPAGGALIVYEKTLNSGARVFTRAVQLITALGAPCSKAFECASGFCADGVCCETACTGNCDQCAAGTGKCVDNDAVCTGNCDKCVAGACTADDALCTGNCDKCSGAGTAFNCGSNLAACTGNCDICVGSGNKWDCEADHSLCTGNCDQCTGSGNQFNCSANDAACTGDCDVCAGSGTAFSCGANPSACPGDCQQCAGGGTAWSCQFLAATTVCRIAGGPCGQAELCTGLSAVCPPDKHAGTDVICRPSVGDCDLSDYCTGTSVECPADALVGAGTVCRGTAGPCDVVEECTGTDSACPQDKFAGSSVQCRAASCANAVATLAAQCSGAAATCPPEQTQSCAPKECDGTICGSGCTSDANCNANEYCSAGVCHEKLALGTACGGPKQCASGLCVDDVCCNDACDGQCEACDVAGSLGTCSQVASGPPHGGRPACEGTGACQGSCGQAGTDACSYPESSVTCSEPSCSNGVATPASTCDGTGKCSQGTATPCGDYVCGTDACKTSCAGDSDCASGRVCIQSACVVPGVDAGPDAESEAGSDAEAEAEADAQVDAQADAPLDAASDALADAQADAKEDAKADAPDAAQDALADAAKDAMTDAPKVDASKDAGEDGAAQPLEVSSEDGGCGCRTESRSTGRPQLMLALGLALLFLRRRRPDRNPS